jgi:hypothetical protein
MRRGSRLPKVFLCRGNLHNSRRQENHNYGKSGWSNCTSHHFSAILIQDLAFVKLRRLVGVGKFARRQVLVRTDTPACPRVLWRCCTGQTRVSVLPGNLSHCPCGAALSQT